MHSHSLFEDLESVSEKDLDAIKIIFALPLKPQIQAHYLVWLVLRCMNVGVFWVGS